MLFSCGLIVLSARFASDLSSFFLERLLSDPLLHIEVRGNNVICGEDKIRSALLLGSKSPKFSLENVSTGLADACNVDKVDLKLGGLKSLVVSIQRLPDLFLVECSKAERRLVSRSLRLSRDGDYPDPAHLVRLEGFDRIFCRTDVIQPESRDLAEKLVRIYDLVKDKKDGLTIIRSRLPRGVELFFENIPSSFLVSLSIDSEQYRRLEIAFRSRIPSGSIVSLDLEGKLLISRSERAHDSLE